MLTLKGLFQILRMTRYSNRADNLSWIVWLLTTMLMVQVSLILPYCQLLLLIHGIFLLLQLFVNHYLVLSPWTDKVDIEGGIKGVKQINFQFTIASCNRLWSSSNSGYTISASLGGQSYAGTTYNAFVTNDTYIYLGCKQTQPAMQGKIKPLQVLPCLEWQYWVSNPSGYNAIASGGIGSVQSVNNQLGIIPEEIRIAVRKPVANKTAADSDSFLSIVSADILFDGMSGLLSSASTVQLYELSKKNGYRGDWDCWRGYASKYSPSADARYANVATSGSVLIIKPAYDLSLKEGLSAGSLTNSNFQVNLGVLNQTSASLTPELIILFKHNGIWTTLAGMSTRHIGYLDKDDVLKVKLDEVPHIYSDDIQQEFGGKLHRPLRRLMRKRNMKSRLDEKKDEGMGMAGSMAAGLSGGAMVGLARHIR